VEHSSDEAPARCFMLSHVKQCQVGCAHLPMSAWSGATISFRLHPARRGFQPPSYVIIVILVASDPTYTAVHCWRSCVSGGWKPSLEQSAARRHLSSNADCLSEPPQNLSLPDHFLTKCFWFLFCTPSTV